MGINFLFPSPYSPALGNYSAALFVLDSPILDISRKWSPTVCDLLCSGLTHPVACVSTSVDTYISTFCCSAPQLMDQPHLPLSNIIYLLTF